eukprot:2406889-Alexandrium_andersonii.AAC.1
MHDLREACRAFNPRTLPAEAAARKSVAAGARVAAQSLPRQQPHPAAGMPTPGVKQPAEGSP